MNILVAGGAGYIGSHICVELLNKNYSVIIADNLINSSIETIEKIKQLTQKQLKFYQIDVTDESSLDELFSKEKIDGVIHLAGFKAVGESVEKPLSYYYNNLVSTIQLSKSCIKYKVDKFIFSSSATVYGDNLSPINEEMELLPTTNPYGETKVMCERILTDVANVNPEFNLMLLRYFNPVGAHESGIIGEDPNGIPNNLMPFVAKVAKGELDHLNVFGDDYETPDGTGIRDYIHVVDLALGHISALQSIKSGINIYNLGTGSGVSVLELVDAFEQVNDIKVPYSVVDRRAGDIAECYADPTKAKRELGWTATYDIKDMCRDAWKFEKMSNNKKASQ